MSKYGVSKTREDWVATLRSGRYPQSTSGGYLRARVDEGADSLDDVYCCLGVLFQIDPGFYYQSTNAHDTLAGFGFRALAPAVRDIWPNPDYPLFQTELGEAIPDWMTPDQEQAAILANDTLKWTFDEIANWVEAGMPIKGYRYKTGSANLQFAPDRTWVRANMANKIPATLGSDIAHAKAHERNMFRFYGSVPSYLLVELDDPDET